MHKELRRGDQVLISEATGLSLRWVNKVLTGKSIKETATTKRVVRIAKEVIQQRKNILKNA